MANLPALSDLERDALSEEATIGAGHAATALSQMTGRKIMISVPAVSVRSLESAAELAGPPGSIIRGVLMPARGALTGRPLVVLGEASAPALCALLPRRPAAGAGFD